MTSAPRLPSAGCRLAGVALLAFGTWGPLAHAQTAAQAPSSARAETCTARPGRLGVARILEIDTERGPRFGLQQYKDHDFLRENEVVLTFDDGPLRRNSRMVLEALAAHCTQATFFLVGQMALTDPEMVREIARAGHTIAIHTWSHRNLRAIGAAKATQEIELGISAVSRALGGTVTPFFRFPYLADSPAMLTYLSERNFGVFSIDADSRDFRTRDPRQMQRNMLEALAPKKKGILLFHDIQISTALGIRGVLDELANRNYKVVHLVSKYKASTTPSYDAMAEAEFTRRNKVAAVNPMAPRSVVWPMAQPGAAVETYRPESETGAGATRGPVRREITKAAPARVQSPPAPVAPVPAAAPAPVPAPVVASPPPADTQPTFRGTSSDDWRTRVFQP